MCGQPLTRIAIEQDCDGFTELLGFGVSHHKFEVFTPGEG